MHFEKKNILKCVKFGNNSTHFFFQRFFFYADKSKQCMRLSTLCLYTGKNPVYKEGLYKLLYMYKCLNSFNLTYVITTYKCKDDNIAIPVYGIPEKIMISSRNLIKVTFNSSSTKMIKLTKNNQRFSMDIF